MAFRLGIPGVLRSVIEHFGFAEGTPISGGGSSPVWWRVGKVDAVRTIESRVVSGAGESEAVVDQGVMVPAEQDEVVDRSVSAIAPNGRCGGRRTSGRDGGIRGTGSVDPGR